MLRDVPIVLVSLVPSVLDSVLPKLADVPSVVL